MAVLTAKKRGKLKSSQFGLPGKKAYPMPDKAHAANAKARATQMVKAGKLSPAEAATIRKKADKKLGEKDMQKCNYSKKGQDTYILGLGVGKPGGHAGYGKGAQSGTEAQEEADEKTEPLSKKFQPDEDEAGN